MEMHRIKEADLPGDALDKWFAKWSGKLEACLHSGDQATEIEELQEEAEDVGESLESANKEVVELTKAITVTIARLKVEKPRMADVVAALEILEEAIAE